MAQQPNPQELAPRGYDLKLVVKPEECGLLLCAICKQLCRDAVENEVGTIWCEVRFFFFRAFRPRQHLD